MLFLILLLIVLCMIFPFLWFFIFGALITVALFSALSLLRPCR